MWPFQVFQFRLHRKSLTKYGGGVTLIRSVCLLSVLLLPAAILADSKPADYPVTIKIISSQTLPAQAASSYAQGCNPVDYSAECMHSGGEFVQNRMLVTSSDGREFTIACIIESRWSNCIPLPVGESFHARIEKNGLTVIYPGPKGPRKQHYDVVANVRANK